MRKSLICFVFLFSTSVLHAEGLLDGGTPPPKPDQEFDWGRPHPSAPDDDVTDCADDLETSGGVFGRIKNVWDRFIRRDDESR